jgi:hypothetical protein
MRKYTIALKAVAGGLFLFFCLGVGAQQIKTTTISHSKSTEADKRIEDYLKLLKLGYTEKEIFEDLGNVNFLSENYKTAAFWYQKLIDLSGTEGVSQSYMERYKVAMHKAGIANYGETVAHADWFSRIREDYQIERSSGIHDLTRRLAENYRKPDFSQSNWSRSMAELEELVALSEDESQKLKLDRSNPGPNYTPPVTVSADGKTAYFSKAAYVKPLYGIFSKKQLVHKIYRAENVNGSWMNLAEVGVCPKYASAMHPAISADGKRLFFASDMPGSYGKYDIYVADIGTDGSVGIAKNLGDKVNTRKNDMYPNLVGDNLLFFASDGRDGYGGLDLYAAQVGHRKVGLAVNIGTPFNSRQDDFALNLKAEKGVAYVMSNRGDLANEAQQLVFSYADEEKNSLAQNRKHNFLELLPIDAESGYSNNVYEE